MLSISSLVPCLRSVVGQRLLYQWAGIIVPWEVDGKDKDSFVRFVEVRIKTTVLLQCPVSTLSRMKDYRKDFESDVVEFGSDRARLVEQVL